MKRIFGKISGAVLILIGISIVGFLAWIIGTAVAQSFSEDNEFTTKHEWSIVQDIELRYRNTQLNEPTVLQYDSDNLKTPRPILGLPSSDRSGNIWILLDAKATPKLKILASGDKNFTLTAVQFSKIEPLIRNEEVKRFLLAHVAN